MLVLVYLQCDVVGNSVGTKSKDTENVLGRGVLAQQFGKAGGQPLVSELASSRHACWKYGEIRMTDSHGLNRGGSSPKKIIHFCVPQKYQGDSTYLVTTLCYIKRSSKVLHNYIIISSVCLKLSCHDVFLHF